MVEKTKVKSKKPNPNADLDELREIVEELVTIINNLNLVVYTSNGKFHGVKMNPSGRSKIDVEKWNKFLKNPIVRGQLPHRLQEIADADED